MKATVYNAKKVAIAQIDGVEIRDTEGGPMIRFIVPGRLDIGDGYILFLQDGRRVSFATWDTTPDTTTEQSIFCVSMNPMR